jgi:hypothetical protein
MPSPKLVPLVLSDAERASLEALARKRTAWQSLAQRARIVLACAEDSGLASVTEVAARLEVSREMIYQVDGRGRRGSRGGHQRRSGSCLPHQHRHWQATLGAQTGRHVRQDIAPLGTQSYGRGPSGSLLDGPIFQKLILLGLVADIAWLLSRSGRPQTT